MTIATKAFWLATTERAINTAVQTLLAYLGVIAVSTGITDIDWLQAASVAALATVISILKSISVGTATHDGRISLTKAEVVSPVDEA